MPCADKGGEQYTDALEDLHSANDSLSDLIAGLIGSNRERLSMAEALAHPWLNPSDIYKAAAILFDSPIKEGEDHSFKEAAAHGDDLEVPEVEQAFHSSPMAKEFVAIPEEEPQIVVEKECDGRKRSLSSAYRLCS